MRKRSSTDRDFAVTAPHVAEQAIGEHMDGTPLEDPNAGKNSAAVALGRLGKVGRREPRNSRLQSARQSQRKLLLRDDTNSSFLLLDRVWHRKVVCFVSVVVFSGQHSVFGNLTHVVIKERESRVIDVV